MIWKLFLLFTLMIEEYTANDDKRCIWNEEINSILYDNSWSCRFQENITFEANCLNAIEIEFPKCFVRRWRYANSLQYNDVIIKVKKPSSNLFVTDMTQFNFKFTKLILEQGDLTRIPNDIFSIYYLEEIHITNNNITIVNLNNFLSGIYNSALRKINLSHNKITVIETDEKVGVSFIKDIDVSNNLIEDLPLYFLKNFSYLQHLNLAHNRIKRINVLSFEGLDNLITLDISYNKLTKLGVSVTKLPNLQELSISNNSFKELHSVNFVTLTNLKKLNASFNSIRDIEDDCFQGLVNLEYLDLQHNKIESMNFAHINNLNIPHLKEIYLNNNNIKHVSAETIFQLKSLQIVNLANNDVTQLNVNTFDSLNSLVELDLSSNANLSIIGNPFQSLKHVSKLSLQNIEIDIVFEGRNVSIENFNARNCGIKNLHNMKLYNIAEIKILDLSMNKLTLIDGNSFKVMPTLTRLDLSRNKIKYIQPSSFLYLENLSFLNLFENQLQSISFGVFNGPSALRYVDLSNNVLQSFDVNLLPAIETLYLDDNKIADLDFRSIFQRNVLKLSVGGNQLSCKVLAEIKVSNESNKFDQFVTAKLPVYLSENVNGVSCKNNLTESLSPDSLNSNNTSIMTLLRTAVEKINKNEKSLEALTKSVAKLNDLLENVAPSNTNV